MEITFRNQAQKLLYEYFILPEIVGGHWGNAKPYGHHLPWQEAEVKIGSNVGRTWKVSAYIYSICRGDFLTSWRKQIMVNFLNLVENGVFPELADKYCDPDLDFEEDIILLFGSVDNLNQLSKGSWTEKKLRYELADMYSIFGTYTELVREDT